MTDTSDLLDHLDRRAAAAVADLDRIVDATGVPAFAVDLDRAPLVGGGGRGWRDPRFRAAAAAVVAVALVAAAVVLRDGREETTVATPGTPHRLVLPADVAADFDTVTAFQGGVGGTSTPELTVQAPVGDVDPWPTVVVEHALPEDTTTLDGETVDIGGPEATFETDMAATVGWHDGEVVRYVSSGTMSRDDLVDLARRTVAEGVRPGEALPGHEVLHRGSTTDLITFYNPGADDPDLAMTSYSRGIEEGSEGFVVATSQGSAESWRAAYALSSSHVLLQVRGVDAVLALFETGWSDGWQELSWIEDGTLVRASFTSTDGADREELLALAEQLVVVSDDEWGDLVDLRTTDTATVEPPIEDVVPEGSDPVVLRRDGVTAAVWVEEDDGGNVLLSHLINAASSGGAGSGSLDDLAQTVVRRDTGTGGWTSYYGVVDADVDELRLVDASGRDVEATVALGGSASAPGRLLFVALVPAGDDTGDLIVELTRSTGVEEVVPVGG